MDHWRRFLRVYRTTCALLDELGIPFAEDQACRVSFDDRWLSHARWFGTSFYKGGEIVLSRDHVAARLDRAQATLVHEIAHYWCDRFPDAMRRGHAFRVPRMSWPRLVPKGWRYGLTTALHEWLYDADDERFIGTYSQTDPEECVAEFMADLVVYNPDLRGIRSGHARQRYRGCRRMLRAVRRAYLRGG